jgi:hypothetical protein
MPEWFRRYVDVWKIMETGFGLIAGAFLGAGMMAARPDHLRLARRKRFGVEETTLARAAGGYALYEHLNDRPWTAHAMDSMVIGGLAIADAFACNLSAWLQTLPLVHGYTMKDTVEYWRTIKLDPVIPDYNRWALEGVGGLAALGALMVPLQANGSRWAAGIGLIAAAWGQSILSHVKMLLDPEVLELNKKRKRALPPMQRCMDVTQRVIKKQPAQFATETAFAVAAVVLTGLVAYVLGRRKE